MVLHSLCSDYRDAFPQTTPEMIGPIHTHPPHSLATTTGMDYASIPQPTAGPLSEDIIPKEVSRRGSFFGSFRKSMSQRDIQVEEDVVAHASAADAGLAASVAAVDGQSHKHNEDGKEEKGEAVPSTTSVDARDDDGNCNLCGFPEPSSTSDHRQQDSTKSPEWKTHVMKWLSEAVKSIPAYVERSSIVLVRIEEREDKKEESGLLYGQYLRVRIIVKSYILM